MITEKEYIQTTDISHRKRYAQFFTPDKIAEFMTQWVLEKMGETARILEPAFGLGAFTRVLSDTEKDIHIEGYDIDDVIYHYAVDNFTDSPFDICLHNANYLTQSCNCKYDGILCNPPYLKFHDYDNTTLIPLINNRFNLKLNGFTNIYTLFLLKSIHELNKSGRLAYIIPSEFLNADYGVEVKRALIESKSLRHIIIVDFNQCAFDDALTTACILLCENSGEVNKVRFSKTSNIDNLYSALEDYTEVECSQLDPNVKWKKYYEPTVSSKYFHLVPFSTFAKVSRGIATGANSYFTFSPSKALSLGLSLNCFRRCICHSTDVSGHIFTKANFCELAAADKTVYLFNAKGNETLPNVRSYINFGIGHDIDKKYLTASRKPWYALENRQPAPIWVSVFNRSGLRFVRNLSGAYNLTTFHCVYDKGIIDTDILFVYLVTDMAKEIFMDNSRQYGNGLVKFEPNDLNKGNTVDVRLLTTLEKEFLHRIFMLIKSDETNANQYIHLADEFFRNRYTQDTADLDLLTQQQDAIESKNQIPKHTKRKTKESLPNLFGTAYTYNEDNDTEVCMVGEEMARE